MPEKWECPYCACLMDFWTEGLILVFKCPGCRYEEEVPRDLAV